MAVIGGLGEHTSYGPDICTAIYCLLCIGVVIHEAAHYLYCLIFGVKVKEAKFFTIKRVRTSESSSMLVLGYLNLEEVRSVSVGIFVGIGPLIVNGLLIATIAYYWTEIVAMMGVFPPYFFAASLALGAQPSSADIRLFRSAFEKDPGRGVLEIVMLVSFGVILAVMGIIWVLDAWIILTAAICLFIIIVMVSRKRMRPSYSSYT